MSSKAEEFNQLAREVFAPCYPVIADQILRKTGINQGTCLDLGCGSGYLGLAIAEATDMDLFLLDQDPDMLAICQQNATERKVKNSIRIQSGDVHNIPLADSSVQLAVSRGSMFFWEDIVQAFREIYRVLAPGGMAFVGGGFGTLELKQQIEEQMAKRAPDWRGNVEGRLDSKAMDKYRSQLQQAGIEEFEIDHSPVGLWIIFGKNFKRCQ